MIDGVSDALNSLVSKAKFQTVYARLYAVITANSEVPQGSSSAPDRKSLAQKAGCGCRKRRVSDSGKLLSSQLNWLTPKLDPAVDNRTQ